MKSRIEVDWVNAVFRDVVEFLRTNNMYETAEIVAAAAGRVRISLETRPGGVPSFFASNDPAKTSNVVAFRLRSFGKD
jgi:hypothetical protein